MMKNSTTFQALSRKAKIQYIWDYYRFHILLGLIGMIVLISLVNHFVNYREPLLDIIMVNCGSESNVTKDDFSDFLLEYGYDIYDDAVRVDRSLFFTGDVDDYETAQVLSVILAAGEKDIFFATEDVFLAYASQGAVCDLSDILSEELLESYRDKLIYSFVPGIEGMIPCGIRVSDHPWMNENGYYVHYESYIGILSLSDNPDTAKEFIEYLLTAE